MPSFQVIIEGAPIRIQVSAAQGPGGSFAFVKSANFTAANDQRYTATATLTVTDPTGVEGKGFDVIVRAGTSTIGGVAYTVAGSYIRRIYQGGAWVSYEYKNYAQFAASLTAGFATNKATIVDGDKIAILDSAASSAPKHSLWSLVKSTLKTYFDTLYAATGTGLPSGGSTGDVAKKNSGTNYDVGWETPTSAATANTIVRRDASGGAAFDDLTATTVVATGYISTTGNGAPIGTDGTSSSIGTSGQGSPIATSGNDSSISTIGAISPIYTSGATSPIYTFTADSDIYTVHPSASVKSYNFAALDATAGAALRDSAGTAVLTWGATAGNISISVDTTSTGHFYSAPSTATAGHFITKNGTTPTIAAGRSVWFSSTTGAPQFRNGTGSAVTLIYNGSALGTPSSGTLTNCTGLPIAGLSNVDVNVAPFLTQGNAPNLLDAVGGEATGTGYVVFQDDPALYNPGLNGDVGFNSTNYIYGPGAGPAHRTALELTALATTEPGTNVAAFLETPTSANLAAALTDETGTGLAVFSDGPTLSSPVLNTPVFTATTIADIATLNIPNTRPPCVMFDDFLGTSGGGAFPWADSGTGTTDAGPSGGAGLFYGMVRLNTGATSTNSRTRQLPIGLTTIANGATWRACFAIPTVTDVTVFIGSNGGGSNYGLLYNHGVNSSQWVLSTTGATITTFTTAVAQAGNFLSGKRYQMTLQRVSNTSCTLLLEITDWNSAVWTTVFNGTITHAAETPNWSAATPLITVTTKTAAARTLMLDWFAMHHTGITR